MKVIEKPEYRRPRRTSNGKPLCGPPSGLHEAGMRVKAECPNRAAGYLAFGCDEAGGGWYLCKACMVLTVMWLEEKYEHANVEFQMEPMEA